MCNYSSFSIGNKIHLRLENQATCRKCGSRTDEAGSMRLTAYAGHVSDRVFGYCDKLDYSDPVVCPGCGSRNDYILIPCGFNGSTIFREVAKVREHERRT